MNQAIKLILTAATGVLVAACTHPQPEAGSDPAPVEQSTTASEQQPNILLIVIDDLGLSDLGAYGSEIETPTIDRLAAEGVIFSNAHSYPSCAPTRAALMTGLDPHEVGLGAQNGLGPPGVSRDKLGYRGSLEGSFVGIAERLSEQGYKTYQTGKWHLGFDEDQSPGAVGFDQHFTLLGGVASHYSDRLGISLSIDPPDGMAIYKENGQIVDQLPDDFYSTEYYTSKMIEYIELGLDEDPNKPFFGYLAYTAMHDPLHAPEDLIQKYVHVFADGYEALRTSRTNGLARTGIIPNADFTNRWPKAAPAWDSLSEQQQSEMIRRMATHAAMLDYLDAQLAMLFESLKERGEFADTLIIIASDNGASVLPRTAYLRTEADRDWQYSVYPKVRVSEYGQPGSFPTLGMPNAQAIAGPYFGFKTTVHEGGTRVPMIVKTPKAQSKRRVDDFVHLVDLYPTFLEYAGDEKSTDGLAGCSVKALIETAEGTRCSDEFGMEFLGARAYRSGDWKLVFAAEAFGGTGQYALYDLNTDPGETTDLSGAHPEIVRELSAKWTRYAEERNVQAADMDAVNTFYATIAARFFEPAWGSPD